MTISSSKNVHSKNINSKNTLDKKSANKNPNKNLSKKGGDFLDLSDFEKSTLRHMLEEAKKLKYWQNGSGHPKYLSGKQLAMIFEKNSTRTRVSFEVGINQLGGNGIYLSGKDSQIGRGEPVCDTANVLSRYADLIMIRTFDHKVLEELAEFSEVPVINGLTDKSHPCQIMADILTVEEQLGNIENQIVAWYGDANNVLYSWIEAAEIFGFELRIAVPKVMSTNIKTSKNVKYFESATDAAKGATVITTDTWFSMGDKESEEKLKLLTPYQVNKKIMALADKKAIFLHCLPAHREEEVTSEVIDGKQSFIYDEAENRLHAQKAIMLWCMGVI